MKLLTQREVIQRVANNWKSQYFTKDNWRGLVGGSSGDTYDKLNLLDKDKCHASEVNDIIGNSSWTALQCTCCRVDVTSVVVFSAWEETVYICKNCLNNGINIIGGSL